MVVLTYGGGNIWRWLHMVVLTYGGVNIWWC